MAPKVTWVPPDGGWGWVIAVCSLVLHALGLGLMLSMGVLYVSWIEEFNEDRAATSWIISIAIAIAFGLGPLPAALANVYGFQTVAVVGGLLISAGYILSYFATSIAYLVVSIGLIAGTGCCFMYLSAVAIVSIYFSKKRSLAMGIGTSGTGFGILAFGPLLDYLINTYGWRAALLISGAISLHGCAIGLLIRPLEKVELQEEEEDREPSGVILEGNDLCKKSPMLSPNKQSTENCSHNANETFLQKEIVNKNNIPSLIIEDFPQRATDSNNSLVESQLIDSSHRPDKIRAESMTKIHHSSLRSVNNKKVFCSLRSLNSSSSKYSGLNIPFRRGDKRQRSLDVILARSIKHLGSISLLGTLPKYLIENEDSMELIENLEDENTSQFDLEKGKCIIKNNNRQGCISSYGKHLKEAVNQNMELLRDPTFLLFEISNFMTNLSYATPVMFLVDRAVDSGLDATYGAILVALNGVGNIIGRLFFGAITYWVLKDCLMTYLGVLITAGIINSLSPICGTNIVLHGIYATLIGSLLGGYCTLVAVATVDIMGLEKASSSFGLLLTFFGIATLLGPPFGGLLFDWTQNYDLTYITSGLFLIISALIIIPTVCQKRMQRRREEGTIIIEEVEERGDEEEEERRENEDGEEGREKADEEEHD